MISFEEFLSVIHEKKQDNQDQERDSHENETIQDGFMTLSADMKSKETATHAKKQAKKIMEKMEKIVVAPGEYGCFKNWGTDVFLEEKCFPELFSLRQWWLS